MLKIKNLNLYYDKGKVQALKNINIEINNGEIYSFIGPSGCGKSTMLNILAGIIKNYQGEVLLNNEKINHKSQNIGLIAQNYGLLPWKTVYDNVCLGLKIKNADLNLYENKIKYIMEKLGIYILKDRHPNKLSGGQKQRVSIARTFVMDLSLLLMDEPFSALDAITREETCDLFFEIWNEHKPTTLFVTHSIEEAVFLGKKIIVMCNLPGEIVKVIDNTSFGLKESRTTAEFLYMTKSIRKIIREEWTNKDERDNT